MLCKIRLASVVMASGRARPRLAANAIVVRHDVPLHKVDVHDVAIYVEIRVFLFGATGKRFSTKRYWSGPDPL